MQDDETVIISSVGIGSSGKERSSNGLKIILIGSYATGNNEFYFSHDLSVGRSNDNDIAIPDLSISRRHLEIKREYDGWYITDAGSTNGTYLGDVRLYKTEKLNFPCTIHFGKSDSCLQLYDMGARKINAPIADASDVTQIGADFFGGQRGIQVDMSREDIKRKFLEGENLEEVGEYTEMVRGIIKEDRKKKTRKYKAGLWFAAVLVGFFIGFIVQQQQKIDNARNLAIDIFYDMKVLEVDLSTTEIQLKDDSDQILRESVAKKREKLHEMQNKYKAYVDELNGSKFNVIPKQVAFLRKIPMIGRMTSDPSYEAELILRVARVFGECELELPDGFVDEVKKYIDYWRGSPRMATAMQRLEANHYAPIILDAMHKEGLPVQFLYLSLQESNFNPDAIGPETRYGIAKGAWQFIPPTAQEYGLTTGPLAGVREVDPQDDRHDFTKSTYAGAKFLKHIYSLEAQASGLLVMAGYNWGPYGVRGKVKRMPNNPRDRNFWKFSQQFNMPKETYDYVYYIFSAAVIGEDPKYFGFHFESPTTGNAHQP